LIEEIKPQIKSMFCELRDCEVDRDL